MKYLFSTNNWNSGKLQSNKRVMRKVLAKLGLANKELVLNRCEKTAEKNIADPMTKRKPQVPGQTKRTSQMKPRLVEFLTNPLCSIRFIAKNFWPKRLCTFGVDYWLRMALTKPIGRVNLA